VPPSFCSGRLGFHNGCRALHAGLLPIQVCLLLLVLDLFKVDYRVFTKNQWAIYIVNFVVSEMKRSMFLFL